MMGYTFIECRMQEWGGGGGGGLNNWHDDLIFNLVNCIIFIQISEIVCNYYARFFGAYFSTATLSITELKSHYTWVILNLMSDSERGGGGGGNCATKTEIRVLEVFRRDKI